MTTDKEYQQFADECMCSAREAETDAERKAFLDMARAWTKLANATAVPPIPDEPEHTSH
jgi:predicted lipoprotein